MSWRISDHTEDGMQIAHLDAPRFTARWTTGDFPIDQVREGAFFWTDEGGAPDDAIHLFAFIWRDKPPKGSDMERLMQKTAAAIERHIIAGV